LVVAAGPITNFIFSIAAFALLAFILGRDIASIDTVEPNSPAAAAGLQAGDVVTYIDGERIDDFQDLQRIVALSPNRTLNIITRRGEQDISMQLTPRPRADNPQVGSMGVGHTSSMENRQRIDPLTAIGNGASNTWQIIAQTGGYIAGVFTGRESGNQIAGPLGIINVSGQVATSALSGPGGDWLDRLGILVLSLLNLAAVLSVAVGIVNLLPIPILDGGHLLFYAIEGVRGGKPLPPAAQEWAYRAGFAVMASLFLFATWNDITRLFPGAQ
jgi:regulator of sigma E protease